MTVEECLLLIEKEGETLISTASRLRAYSQAQKPAYSEVDLHEQAGTAIIRAVEVVRGLVIERDEGSARS
jgi:hypothetical protein